MTETADSATSPATGAASSLPEALGAHRIAEALAQHTGAGVTADDVHALVDRGLLEVVDHYKRWPLYETAAALAVDPELVRALAEERIAWRAASLTRDEAAERIGWHWRDIARMGAEGRVTTGRFGRYLTADIDRLAEEADGEQHITAAAAAEVLEIRDSDWRYVEAAGWIAPAEVYDRPVGRGKRTVPVALFRLEDVRALREMPGVAWEEIRGLPKGVRSPLREYAELAPTRAAVIKRFAQALADEHQVAVWAWHSPYSGCWELDWERRADGTPSRKQVAGRLADQADIAAYAEEIVLCPFWGRLTRQARALLEPDVAVILDTETTSLDGQAIEIAVLDAATGRTRMDTLVRPTEPISHGAYWVHGISDAEVARARPIEKVVRRLREVTRDRIIIAYNASFDRGILTGDIRRCGRQPKWLADPDSWWCLMEAYAAWLGSSRWLPLGGAHRAAGDCGAAREVLLRIAKGRGVEFSPKSSVPCSRAECP